MRNQLALFAVLLASASGCAAKPDAAPPAFVDQLVARLQAEPKKNPPGKVWQYRYRNQVVFYVPPSCCDIPGVLYASDGQVVFSPDGGMTGRGDGKCPDFFDARTEERLVWSDPR